MFYKNISYSVKTFHGLTFKPNEIREVSKPINSKFMILVEPPKEDTTKLETELVQEQMKPSSEYKAKKDSKVNKKIEEPKETAEQPEEISPESEVKSEEQPA